MSEQRALAARTVSAVMRGRALDDALPSSADGFTRALAYGVLREHRRLAALAAQMLDKPAQLPPEIHALILCGLYQLRSMDVAAYAAVSETVETTSRLNQPKTRGLVNAVLRRYQREREDLEAGVVDDLGTRYSSPDWLVREIQRDWPQGAEKILAACNEQGPMSLRLNRRRAAPELPKHRRLEALTDAVVLDVPCAVEELPGFAEGSVSVQDAAAQLAAVLLDAQPGERVLDACAAPGGKTAHILEQADVEMLALDHDAARLKKVEETLQRLGLKAATRCANAADTESWWDGKPFDRILLDAPCSGSGVIRRHPDIKWLRRETDLPRLVAQQLRLLNALWPLLAPGGVLLYATCSVFEREGDSVMRKFLAQHDGLAADQLALPIGEATRHGWRIAPGGDWDGFYYARLRKL